MQLLRDELREYYAEFRSDKVAGVPAPVRQIWAGIVVAMNDFAASNPDCHPSLMKAQLHHEIAERFQPVIFPHSPFFFEMGMRFSENWGCPYPTDRMPAAWLFNRNLPLIDEKPEREFLQPFNLHGEENRIGLWNVYGASGFDSDHHSIGYTKLLRVGINGILQEIVERMANPVTPHQLANLQAMEMSCRAVLRVAERFNETARVQLLLATDPQVCKFLNMIIDATERVPALPPRTFHEGLAMMWFLREVTASMEAIGISVVGHIDRLLYPLYRADIDAGRLTEDEARDLLARWMMPNDIKFHVDDSSWPETSTCMELGGCDENGDVVWNDLTRLIIETHHAHKFFNPKLNCRYSANSPQEYLDLISETILDGHNHFALLNDDILIPACVRAGKTIGEARLYVNGGCQETIVEGVEHSAGAYYYFNMSRVLDICLRPLDHLPAKMSAESSALLPKPITADNFEEFYGDFIRIFKQLVATGAGWMAEIGKEQWKLHPCPFFSTTLSGCIDNGMDYTQGGAKYNPSGISLVGLGTLVDSLFAIKKAVYEDKKLTLDELRQCLTDNWVGHEDMRRYLKELPKFGHGDEGIDNFAADFAKEIAEFVRTIPSERGGKFQPGFFVYYAFEWFAPFVRALPDGRQAGDLLSQGVTPHRATAPDSLTDVFHSLSHIDFRDYSGNCVLDVQLPTGSELPVNTLSAVIRTFAALGGPTLQLNYTSVDELKDAQLHPDEHRDLVVRISGLSAHFVCLQKYVQDEIISRALMSV